MTKPTIFAALAVLLVATATGALASDALTKAGASYDDYSRYSSVDGPRAPLMQSFAPNRDDALMTDLYGPFDYLFGPHGAMDPNAVRTASTSTAVAGPRS
jgi:hypothetical protein